MSRGCFKLRWHGCYGAVECSGRCSSLFYSSVFVAGFEVLVNKKQLESWAYCVAMVVACWVVLRSTKRCCSGYVHFLVGVRSPVYDCAPGVPSDLRRTLRT